MHGRLKWRRLTAACCAGFSTLLIGLLCSAALAAPTLAAEPDFAHSHPAGTQHHLHPLELILGSGPVPLQASAPTPERVDSAALPALVLPWVSALGLTLPHSRAPPKLRQTSL